MPHRHRHRHIPTLSRGYNKSWVITKPQGGKGSSGNVEKVSPQAILWPSGLCSLSPPECQVSSLLPILLRLCGPLLVWSRWCLCDWLSKVRQLKEGIGAVTDNSSCVSIQLRTSNLVDVGHTTVRFQDSSAPSEKEVRLFLIQFIFNWIRMF